ncbi:L-ascorbate oxidase-like protein [Hordeum vulgare]|nr:L-ascorbate oxidase-like protein [Hordeum vulgare]
MVRIPEQSEEEVEEILANAPPAKKKKLMADAMTKRFTTKPPTTKAKKPVVPKKTTKDIHVANKDKGTTYRAFVVKEVEEDDSLVLMKLIPLVPLHNEDRPIVEYMKKTRHAGLRKWRSVDQYTFRRRNDVDPCFHTKEQQDFYKTDFLDNSLAVSDMRYLDWAYVKANEDYCPHMRENFKLVEIEYSVGKKMASWNDEMIMQFYSTVHFYADGTIFWMTNGHRYEATIEEWATIIGAPKNK